MLTLLADAMFTATLARRGSEIPENLKAHPDRYISDKSRKNATHRSDMSFFRDLW